MINYAIVDDTYGQVIAEDSNRNPFNLYEAVEFAQKWRDGLKLEYRANVRVVELITVWPGNSPLGHLTRDNSGNIVDSRDNDIHSVRTDFNP
jgi:uncharacterized protein YeaC (DUF1315 family)